MQTESEIRNSINELSSQKSDLINIKTKYNQSLDYANKCVEQLEIVRKRLDDTKTYLKKYFNMDGQVPYKDKIATSMNSTDAVLNTLKNTIIPKIKKNVSDLETKIDNLANKILTLQKLLNNLQKSRRV